MSFLRQKKGQNLEETKDDTNASNVVVDITGEDENGGTTSKLFNCNECNYTFVI